MRTELTHLTPALARQWLDRNAINRALRPGAVETWRRIFQRGEYHLTHQGIAFDTNGDLADGQHRLHAIASMPEDFALDMLVSFDLEPAAFEGIDQGLRRTAGDVLNIPQGLAAVGRTLASIRETSRVAITPHFTRPFIEGIAGEYYPLVDYCPKVTRVFASSMVRAAACLQMATGSDRDYVKMSYFALNHREYDSMRPIVQTFNRQVEARSRGDARADTRGWQMFCRAFKAFDSDNQALETVVVNDVSSILEKARTIIEQRVLKTIPIDDAARSKTKKKHYNELA